MKLVVFDVDGTLIDSQHHIVGAMNAAFADAGLPPLDRGQILRIVGLSLPVAVAELAGAQPPDIQARITQSYRRAFMQARVIRAAPLYPGARECLDRLAERADVLLAIATGKSRRGVDAMMAAHGLEGRFASIQTADDHPSKPHPAMLRAALDDTVVKAGHAVMVGDTSFDMDMARQAGLAGLGVGWGYHPPAALRASGAGHVADDFAELGRILAEWAA